MKPSPERLKDLRDFVKHCEQVTTPGVVSGESYLYLVRELLAACDSADQPAPTETGPTRFETASVCNCAAQLDTLRTHAESCPMAEPAPQGAPPCDCGAEREHARGTRGIPHAINCAMRVEPQGAPCLHTLNELGHCTRCGARPNDKPQGAPPGECTCGHRRASAVGAD